MEEPFALTVTDDTAEVLNKALQLQDFFPEFKAEHAVKLFPRSTFRYYPAGYKLIAQGDTGRDIFVICLGGVKISKTMGDAGAEVAVLGAGDMFGEIALVRDGVRMATAVTAEESQIFQLVHEDIQYLLKNNQPLVDHLRALARKRLIA